MDVHPLPPLIAMKGKSLLCRFSVIASLTVISYLLIWRLFSSWLHSAPRPLSHEVIHAQWKNIWMPLTLEEIADVNKFLHNVPSLSLTDNESATYRGNYIDVIDLLQPNKTDTTKYLNGISQDLPPRWARVEIYQGATSDELVYEYMVGPLPVSLDTRIYPLEYCYNSGRHFKQYTGSYLENLFLWSKTVLPTEFGDIVTDLLGVPVDGKKHISIDDIGVTARKPSAEGNRTIYWCSFRRNATVSQAYTLLPQGLYVKVDMTGRDTSKWSVLGWMYNSIIYESTEDLRAALQHPGFQRTPLNLDGDWTVIEDFGQGLRERALPAPAMVQPFKSRYGLDRKENYVSWMGFEFYLSFSQVTGISLHNIKFRGESIIYELGLQEALAQYAGDDAVQGALAFLDTQYNMGALMFELVPGYDCPAYASFLDSSFYYRGEVVKHKNNICIFEYTADHALQRHTAYSYVTISRNTYFIVRAVSVVGNYDYTFDYIFYLDGSIEVKVRASGYIEGSFWAANRSPEYGYRAHDQFATSIHDHVLNFKADMDVAGPNNTLVRVVLEPHTMNYTWDSVPPRKTMRLVEKPVLEEVGLSWPRNGAELYVVVNNDSHNAWGMKRGYQVRPGTGMGTPVTLMTQNSTAMEKAIGWVGKDLWVTRQKDTEPRSASPANAFDPLDPQIDFSKFVDGESVVQEDLVIYFNLGTHHIAHSGDIPNTLMHTSASSVMFTPHNFHDRDPSRASSQGVRVDLEDRNKTRYYGGRYIQDMTVKLSELEPDLVASPIGPRTDKRLYHV